MPRVGQCSCKKYSVPCDEECNCCDSPYAIEGCDCECSERKAQHVAQILKQIIDDGGLAKLKWIKENADGSHQGED